MAVEFKVSHSYSFDVYPSPILGTGFSNCTVLSIMDHDSAALQVDTMALHAQVYPFLPAGTPDDPTLATYIKIRLPSGDTTILGSTWINTSTVKEIKRTTIVATIKDVTPNDLDTIRRVLLANGFEHIDLTTK